MTKKEKAQLYRAARTLQKGFAAVEALLESIAHQDDEAGSADPHYHLSDWGRIRTAVIDDLTQVHKKVEDAIDLCAHVHEREYWNGKTWS